MGSCAYRASWPAWPSCPVMHGTIVCGVTDTTEARAAVQVAAALAGRLGLRLVLVHAAEPRLIPHERVEEAEQRVQARTVEPLEALARELCDDVESQVVRGSRVAGLTRVAADEGADVIVLGSRPRGARGHQLRCTLACELEAAQAVPVLIAPPATRRRSGRRLALVEAAPER